MGVVTGVLVDLIFFLVFFLCLFDVVMDVGRCFIRSIFSLGHVEKWPFLMAWIMVLRIGPNSEAWYHYASSVLILSTKALSDAGCDWVGRWYGLVVKLTVHMHDVFYWLPLIL